MRNSGISTPSTTMVAVMQLLRGLERVGPDGLDAGHLNRLRLLCDRYDPESFSEHLAWSSHGADYLNDLLPVPYTEQTLARVCDHVDLVQSVLGRRMLLENPATYLLFAQSTIPETEFLAEVARRTGCGCSRGPGWTRCPLTGWFPKARWRRSTARCAPACRIRRRR